MATSGTVAFRPNVEEIIEVMKDVALIFKQELDIKPYLPEEVLTYYFQNGLIVG